jgi:hypothetical protein
MERASRRLLSGSAAVLALVLPATAAAAGTPPLDLGPSAACPAASLLVLDHHQGGGLPNLQCTVGPDDGVYLTADQWTVPLPPVGMQVTSTALTTQGHTEFIVRNTAADGLQASFLDTGVQSHGAEGHEATVDGEFDAAPGPYQGGAPNRCDDQRWSSLGHTVYGPMVWSYNPTGAPSGVAAASEGAFVTGYDNVAATRDGCNIESTAALTTQTYTGTTATPPNISSVRTCTPYDGLNVAGWVPGSTGYLGLACIWSYVDGGRGPAAIDADIILNSTYAWSTGPTFSGSEYDVTSVVSHEAGHVFGLGHAGDSASPSQLTMSGSGVYPGSIYARLLGAGDLEGLTTLYGAIGVDR